MKLFKEKNVIFTIYSSLSVVLGAISLLLILSWGIALYSNFVEDDSPRPFPELLIAPSFFEARIFIDGITDFQDEKVIAVENISGDFYYLTNQKWIGTLELILSSTIFYGLFMMLVLQVRKLIKSIYLGEVFSYSNIKNLKVLSILFIVIPIIIYGVSIFFLSSSIPEKIILHENTITIIPVVKNYIVSGFFIGGLIYTLSFAFEKGFQLKSENDLTI